LGNTGPFGVRTDRIIQNERLCKDKGADKIIQVITMRTSGIILDRVKRTAWATQDSEDRQDKYRTRRQFSHKGSRGQTGKNMTTRTHGIRQDPQERPDLTGSTGLWD
jgi:hypothetical protein